MTKIQLALNILQFFLVANNLIISVNVAQEGQTT